MRLQSGFIWAFCAWGIIPGGCARYEARPLEGDLAEAWRSRPLAPENLDIFLARVSGEAPPTTQTLNLADGLALAEAEIVTLALNPDLRRERAGATVAAVRARNAGLLEEPVVSFEAQKVLESVADPWVLLGAVEIGAPIWGRLRLERSRADAQTQAELWRVADEESRQVMTLRKSWAAWSAAREKASEIGAALERLAPVAETYESLAAQDEIPRAEARAVRIQMARMRAELARIGMEADELDMGLKAAMGLRADAAVELIPELRGTWAGDGAVNHDTTTTSELVEPPALLRARAEYDAAERGLELAVRAQFPEPRLTGLFERDQDLRKPGVGISIPLPIIHRGRPAIELAQAEREARRAAWEAERERWVAERARAEARLRAARAAVDQLVHEVVPMVQEQHEEIISLVRLQSADLTLLLNALETGREIRAEIIDAQLKVAVECAELAYLNPTAPTATLLKIEQHGGN